MQKKYFGTDGIRGKVGKSLINPEFMLKLGWAIGKILANNCRTATVLIGKDTRISGYMIESALQAGLSAAGVNVKLTGPIPTPAIAYLTHSVRADAGIVISASHNSYPDNGVKFFNREGFKLSNALELAIEENIDKPMRTVSIDRLGKTMRMHEAYGRYIEFCKSTFPSNLSLKQLKIVIDCANGAVYSVAPIIFHELGSDVIAIGNEPNGFNINHGYGTTNTQKLQKSVLTYKADVGIAFDGDGDRLIMIDNYGSRVDGDELLCIMAINRFYLKEHCPLGVVGTVMSNLGLEQALKRHSIAFERSPVGDRCVLELIRQKGWLLGGESSGHIVDLNFTTTGDGIITALQILRIMQQTNSSLSELKKVMTKYPQALINIPINNDIPNTKYLIIRKAIIEEAKKRLSGRGRVLVRPSGTEPVMRVMVEGYDKDIIKKTVDILAITVEKTFCIKLNEMHILYS
ncbi:phosphoglucosamine mutase [Coxiella endosymbiont of Amblyomma americanum]|uniref:phosphoglucosamine mutase n=1 Tax=Coxiella endosymbiont of Amblyomma americanum TaxID=325775 RepID=UPI00057E5855|nr:phosphoglucosamine mutase [Coxiella endosymbiont of Amblyomma americanum]AJC50534.1 phosphoglucosamine mutase [Coxiella endosymbiont of Amblyomma americanum]AUJ59051.1 phosphoglucosamine mutase [Coxiella-like endosymbiont of Amblyomma americanum]